MLAVESKPSAAGFSPTRPLALESGEFMHSREFLRRYERMPQLKKAELIEGIVYMGSPVSTNHAIPDGIIHGWLLLYASRNPGVQFMPNATVILDAENTVQPDALLRRLPEHGGLTRVNEAGYLAGPPELIVEVAASSASIDLRDKRRAYCRNGVREYLGLAGGRSPPGMALPGRRRLPSAIAGRARRAAQPCLSRPPPARRTALGRRHRQCPGGIDGARTAKHEISRNQCQK